MYKHKPTFAELLARAIALAYAQGKARQVRAKVEADRQAWERDFHANPETQA